MTYDPNLFSWASFIYSYLYFCARSDVRVSATIDLPRRPLLRRGSTVTLLCNISVETAASSQVEVQWLQKPEEPAGKDLTFSEDSKGRLIATLTYDGLTRIYSNGSDLSVDRVSAACFRLRIFSATEEDQGHYQCQAEVWSQDPRGGWYNTGARAESVTAHLYLYARGESEYIKSVSIQEKPVWRNAQRLNWKTHCWNLIHFSPQLLICCSFLSWSACRRRCSWVCWLLRRWRAASWRDWQDSALTSGSRKYERDFHGKPVRTKTWLEQRKTSFKQVLRQTWCNVNSQLETAS